MYKICSTLKKDHEFRRVYTKGKSAVSSGLVVYCLKRKYGGIRVGITTGKKVGNAVKRNRARRVIREAVRRAEPLITGSWDIVFVARTKTPCLKSYEIERMMLRDLSELKVINTVGAEESNG